MSGVGGSENCAEQGNGDYRKWERSGMTRKLMLLMVMSQEVMLCFLFPLQQMRMRTASTKSEGERES